MKRQEDKIPRLRTREEEPDDNPRRSRSQTRSNPDQGPRRLRSQTRDPPKPDNIDPSNESGETQQGEIEEEEEEERIESPEPGRPWSGTRFYRRGEESDDDIYVDRHGNSVEYYESDKESVKSNKDIEVLQELAMTIAGEMNLARRKIKLPKLQKQICVRAL